MIFTRGKARKWLKQLEKVHGEIEECFDDADIKDPERDSDGAIALDSIQTELADQIQNLNDLVDTWKQSFPEMVECDLCGMVTPKDTCVTATDGDDGLMRFCDSDCLEEWLKLEQGE